MLPKGFVDAKEASFKVVKEIALDENDYRFGHTKVLHLVLIHACITKLNNQTLIEIFCKLTASMQINNVQFFCTILELSYFQESFSQSITLLTLSMITLNKFNDNRFSSVLVCSVDSRRCVMRDSERFSPGCKPGFVGIWLRRTSSVFKNNVLPCWLSSATCANFYNSATGSGGNFTQRSSHSSMLLV